MRQAFLVLVLLVTSIAAAQQRQPDVSEIGAEAAVIFRGEVVAVEMSSPRAPDEIAETRVTLRVDDGVRGVVNGQTLSVRQWNAAADEYRVGESLVLFLHAPSSKLGLTSPVGGRAGHRRVDEVPDEVLDGLRAPGPSVAPLKPTPELTGRPGETSLSSADIGRKTAASILVPTARSERIPNPEVRIPMRMESEE